MFATEIMKKNIIDFIATMAFMYDEDVDEVVDFIRDMDFPTMFQSFRKSAVPIYRHNAGNFDEDLPAYYGEKLFSQNGTMICRDVDISYGVDDLYECRRYLELWILEDMSLRFVSNFTTIYDDGEYYTEYREDKGSQFPTMGDWLDIEDVVDALMGFWDVDSREKDSVFYEN